MVKAKRTTLAVNDDRKRILERLAIDASVKIGKSVLWTDIVNYTIDNYAKDATKDMIHSINNQKN